MCPIASKHGRPVDFHITADVRSSLLSWLERRGGSVDNYAFPNRTDHRSHLSKCQYARLVDEWINAIGLRREDSSTHSLRRTKALNIYKATGNFRAIQILLGHTKIENTVRSLGVDIEDALELRSVPGFGLSPRGYEVSVSGVRPPEADSLLSAPLRKFQLTRCVFCCSDRPARVRTTDRSTVRIRSQRHPFSFHALNENPASCCLS